MNWVNELKHLYDKKSDEIAPFHHMNFNADVTITIDTDGNFIDAQKVSKDDRQTPSPYYKNRTVDVIGHALFDTVKYLDSHYYDYCKEVKEKNKVERKEYQDYLQRLSKWDESSFSHPKVRAVLAYIKRQTIIRDLIETKIIDTETIYESGENYNSARVTELLGEQMPFTLGEAGDYDSETIGKLNELVQEGCLQVCEKFKSDVKPFVRFRVISTEPDAEPCCWKDSTLQQCFSDYIKANPQADGKRGMSYLGGGVQQLTTDFPKGFIKTESGAKLISSNDSRNFTYRGRFSDAEEALSLGEADVYEVCEALKWIVGRQSFYINGVCVVIWRSADDSAGEPAPDLCQGTAELCVDIPDAWDEPQRYSTGEVVAQNLRKAFRDGYRLQPNAFGDEKIVFMTLEAATPGRLSLTYYNVFAASEYCDNLIYWHTSCAWRHWLGDNRYYYGVPGVLNITRMLYGMETDRGFELSKNRKKMWEVVFKRLRACIVERGKLPYDFVQTAVLRASNPQAFNKEGNWRKVLTTACSLVKKYRFDINKEEWTMALNEECTDRSYLYGRLLAVADRIEWRTYNSGEGRQTNAKRYMSSFSQKPYATWKIIEERIQSYLQKLHEGERIVYGKLISEICSRFTTEQFTDNTRLDGLYLLGYHQQEYALKNKNNRDENKEENING